MDVFPPRILISGILPAILLILVLLVFFRASFVEKLPLKALTFIHVIRIPVEIVLLWLFQQGLVPSTMTFEGNNFDILSGVTAPIIFLIAFRKRSVNKPLLIAWNLIALGLLAYIVATALLAFPSPMQKIAFDQPNIALEYFPLIWLPGIVVPLILFSHLASLWKLFTGKTS